MSKIRLEPDLVLLNGGLQSGGDDQPQRGVGRPRLQNSDLAQQKLADISLLDDIGVCPQLNRLTNRIHYIDPTDGDAKIYGGNDAIILPLKLATTHGTTLNEANFKQAWQFIADRDGYAPHIDYIEGCKATVKPANYFSRLALRYFNISNDLLNTALRKFFIGLVARAYQPGCSFSWMPILVGGQGIGKSAFARACVPSQLFSEITATLDILNKEAFRMHVAWLLELAEVEQCFLSKQAEMLKNLVSVRYDEVRLPYQLPSQMPRGFGLIGTANTKEILVDGTGNRRFVPIDIGGHKIPWRQLEEERDAIWAAALIAYEKGESWELSDKELTQLTSYQKEFELRDPWHDTIAAHLENKDSVRIEEILTSVVCIPIERQNTSHRRRAGGILRALGFDVKVVKINGKNARVWKSLSPKVVTKVDDF